MTTEPLNWPITIRRGREFSEYFGFRNYDGTPEGTPFDLTSYVVKAQARVRQSIDSELVVDFTVRIPDRTTGDTYMELTDTQATAIKGKRAYYDVLLIDASNGDVTKVEGVATIKGSVTSNA